MSAALTIDRARPDEWLAAFNLAYHRAPAEERRLRVVQALHFLDRGDIDPDGVLVARQRGALSGVQVCVPLGGANFLFWLPETQPAGVAAVEDALVRAGLTWCRERAGKIAQVIMVPQDAQRAPVLLRHEFAHVTRLFYLEHDLVELPADPTGAAPLHLESFAEENAASFAQTLARTYVGTLDCPELNGVRTVAEILDGYRSARPFNPERWWLLRTDNAPAGVAILTDLPESDAWDLSYVGIVPEHRRRGLGRAATCRALHAAHAAGVATMVVAVDARNTPARQLYRSIGFSETDVREVFLHFFQGASGCD